MNLYFLVEGRRTERKVYPKWLEHLLPQFSRVDRYDHVKDLNYFLLSGEGYPSLLKHLANAISDINKLNAQRCAYQHLVLCLDAEEETVESRTSEVTAYLAKHQKELLNCNLQIVVQNRSIETWCLGNRKLISPANVQRRELREFFEFYNVRSHDPELMGKKPGFTTHAGFHARYLREVFFERGIRYSKANPGHICDAPYLQQLEERVNKFPEHLRSFQTFLAFCSRIRDESALKP